MQIEPATERLFHRGRILPDCGGRYWPAKTLGPKLIAEILQVSKMGPRHAAAISRCATLFGVMPAAKAGIRGQLPSVSTDSIFPNRTSPSSKPRTGFLLPQRIPNPKTFCSCWRLRIRRSIRPRRQKDPSTRPSEIPELWIVSWNSMPCWYFAIRPLRLATGPLSHSIAAAVFPLWPSRIDVHHRGNAWPLSSTFLTFPPLITVYFSFKILFAVNIWR